jgi:GNAT superfamily N-acetyltransferase
MSDYEISSDRARLDIGAIHAFLTQSYWSPGIPRATVERAIANSLCFGAFQQGAQVGFARVVTDRTTFAYLCDVYVLEEHRGRGLAQQLMTRVVEHPDLQGLRRILLATRDAHGLYAKFGFKPLAAPEVMMEVHRPNVYSAG